MVSGSKTTSDEKTWIVYRKVFSTLSIHFTKSVAPEAVEYHNST